MGTSSPSPLSLGIARTLQSAGYEPEGEVLIGVKRRSRTRNLGFHVLIEEKKIEVHDKRHNASRNGALRLVLVGASIGGNNLGTSEVG